MPSFRSIEANKSYITLPDKVKIEENKNNQQQLMVLYLQLDLVSLGTNKAPQVVVLNENSVVATQQKLMLTA